MSESKEVRAGWKDALKQQVAAAANAKPEFTGIPQISLKGGRMSLGDEYIPGDEIQCIILASTLERAWYDRPYDPDDNDPPDCFAIGDKAAALMPHKNVVSPPSDNCKGCPLAEFGTARQGKGPACKTRMRLLLMPVPSDVTPDMITAPEAQVAIYKTQPTSVVHFNGAGGGGKKAGYQKVLAEQGITTWAVMTKVKLLPSKKNLHETHFDLVRPLGEDELLAAAYSRTEAAEVEVATPYTYEQSAEETPEAAAPATDEVDGARF